MASALRRSIFRASPLLRNAAVSAERQQSAAQLRKEAQKNPELYVLFGIMGSVFAAAGYYFASNPTSNNSEQSVPYVKGSEPWKTGQDAQYQYHPYGDKSKVKDAPSPLRVSIIPNVNLPKSLHEEFNKYGKDGYP